MIVCFTCGPETKAQLDRLVATGHYHDHSDVISAAIQNLVVIHSELKDGRSIVIDRGVVAPTSDAPTTKSQPSVLRSAVEAGIPPMFQRGPEISKPEQFAGFKPESPLTAKSSSVEHWMFGQYNRLLPAKATCRALANISAEGGDRRSLEKIAMDIANEAAKLGSYLSAFDEKRNFGRDDAIAVAFPKSTAASEFKSVQRFANQFVGSANKEGQLLGLPVALKLIGRNPDFPDSVGLTEAGWQFGMMPNPILDALSPRNTEKFSDEEISFLLGHILTSVPVEAFAYRAILNEITCGVLTPDDLDAALSKLSGAQKKMEKSFVSTQRSGAICRMADLGLVGRSRSGTRVSYVLPPRGKEFLRQTNAWFDASKSA